MQIEASDVAALLKSARAPKVPPTEHLAIIAQFLRRIATQNKERRGRKIARTQGDRVFAAMQEMQRAIPKVAESYRHAAAQAHFADDAPDFIKYADEIEKWLEAAPDFSGLRQCKATPWVDDAVAIFYFYRRWLGGGISKDGPGVRFVKKCFEFVGVHKEATLNSIEKALRKAAVG